jgi:DNA-binding NtrC family response regulator
MYTILVTEDESSQRQLITAHLKRLKTYNVLEAEHGVEALGKLDKHKVDVVLLDLGLPVMDGRMTLEKIRNDYPSIPVIVLTANEEVDEVVKMMQLGAEDFITKPFHPQRLQVAIKHALEKQALSNEVAELKQTVEENFALEGLIGAHSGLKECVKLAKKAVDSDIPIFLSGESGVGKEVFAKAVHLDSKRANAPFIAINCGAIPENLIESTLFGHEKGAFTGAISKEIGKFREAEGGTLFLDEVGELTASAQVKLLRVLQEGEVEPVGAGKPVKVDVRIISATNRDLEGAVANDSFRKDLFYRLNVFPIPIMPLQERKQDILKLAQYFLQRYSAVEKKAITFIDEEVQSWLVSYNWPGNIRELRNVMFRAVLLCDGEALMLEHIRQPMNETFQSPEVDASNVHVNKRGKLKTMEQLYCDAIKMALEQTNGNIKQAAEILDIGQSTLYRKLTEMKG